MIEEEMFKQEDIGAPDATRDQEDSDEGRK